MDFLDLLQTFGFDSCRVREQPELVGIGQGRRWQ
jgi:hypothetical protein